MMLRIHYGSQSASAYFDSHGSLTVTLDRDPGSGPMTFARISPTTVTVDGGDVDDIARAAAHYRRVVDFLAPGPGRERHASEAARLESLAAGGAHDYRITSRRDGSYDARCACGAACVVFATASGATWHADHIAGRIPGQEPRCYVCRELATETGGRWIHAHTGEAGCGTGDGSTAYPAHLARERGLLGT